MVNGVDVGMKTFALPPQEEIEKFQEEFKPGVKFIPREKKLPPILDVAGRPLRARVGTPEAKAHSFQ